jgi:hypothetical protein
MIKKLFICRPITRHDHHLHLFVQSRSVECLEVLTAVLMKCSVVRDITPCIPLKGDRRFGVHAPPKRRLSVAQRYVLEDRTLRGML